MLQTSRAQPFASIPLSQTYWKSYIQLGSPVLQSAALYADANTITIKEKMESKQLLTTGTSGYLKK